MDRDGLIEWFASKGCTPDALTPGYTTRLVRCGCGRHAWAGVACGDDGAARVVKDFGAALDWAYTRPGRRPLTFVVGRDENERWRHAAEGVELIKPADVELLVDGEPGKWPPAADLVPEDWIAALDRLKSDVPAALMEVERRTRQMGFRWQRTVTGRAWSGRLWGLEVCTVRDSDGVFRFGVGAPGKPDEETGNRGVGAARQHFHDLLEAGNLHASEDGVLSVEADRPERALEVVRLLADGGLASKGSPEHRFEALVNQGRLVLEAGGRPIDLVFPDRPFQFPTRWWGGGHARYVDVLGRQGSTPWVVELKVDLGQGEYYRDGIVQVALYREYVLRAQALDAWFARHRLDRTACRAVLIVPRLTGPDAAELERRHRAVAALLGVELATNAPTRDQLAKAWP